MYEFYGALLSLGKYSIMYRVKIRRLCISNKKCVYLFHTIPRTNYNYFLTKLYTMEVTYVLCEVQPKFYRLVTRTVLQYG